MHLKLRLLNEFGAPDPLDGPDDIEVVFPGENGSIRKRLTHGAVKVLDDSRGEFQVELSELDVECMRLGRNQNFVAIVKSGHVEREAIFTRSLHVDTMEVDGETRKVIAK